MPQSILIVKTSAIGDVIQTFFALEYLQKQFPDAKIDWVAEESIAPLLRAHPMIHRVITIRSKAWAKTLFSKQMWREFFAFFKGLRGTSYDVLFDLQGNGKSALVTLCAKAQEKVGFGRKSVREKCNLLATRRRFDFPPI